MTNIKNVELFKIATLSVLQLVRDIVMLIKTISVYDKYEIISVTVAIKLYLK